MDVFFSILLGALQGLTEFIPVSSSGHLVIANHFVGNADHTFLEFINIGTLAALVTYYRKDIANIINNSIHNKDYRLARNIILTSLPAGVAGLLLSDFIGSNPFFVNIFVVLATLSLVGVLMIVLEKLPKASAIEDGSSLPWHRALIIGLAQMAALVPGVSRSGSTIIAGRLSGLEPKQAADYSFLASIPIMVAVTLKLAVNGSDQVYFADNMPGLIIGNLTAFIVGLLAIRFLLDYLRNHSLKAFGWYRIGLAAVTAIVLLIVGWQ